jgi:hypothetical protein
MKLAVYAWAPVPSTVMSVMLNNRHEEAGSYIQLYKGHASLLAKSLQVSIA